MQILLFFPQETTMKHGHVSKQHGNLIAKGNKNCKISLNIS